jgi:electron transport complex protein RnfD
MTGNVGPMMGSPARMAHFRVRPVIHSGQSHRQIMTSWLLAASLAACAGVILFGRDALAVILVSVISAVLSEWIMALAAERRVKGGATHAVLTGLLLALTLPPTVPWFVPAIGSVVAIVLGKWMLGGFGHFLWQPAVVARVLLHFVFGQYLAFGAPNVHAPVLAPGYLLIGDLSAAETIPTGHYHGWHWAHAGGARRIEAFAVERPVQILRRFVEGKLPVDRDLPFTTLFRDYLPPWADTVLGTVPGGLGETSAIALIVAGLYLIYNGHLRWQGPVLMLVSAAVLAAILPIVATSGMSTALDSHPSAAGGWRWFPGLAVEDGRAVGLLYVVYHLTSGQLLLAAFLLAGDMFATPLTARGHVIFACGVGGLSMLMRLYGVLEGECYWPILAMNTCVPWIDRLTRRRRFGSRPTPWHKATGL